MIGIAAFSTAKLNNEFACGFHATTALGQESPRAVRGNAVPARLPVQDLSVIVRLTVLGRKAECREGLLHMRRQWCRYVDDALPARMGKADPPRM